MGLISRRHAALVAVGAMVMSCLWAAPASAASALVVTPNTNLVDFQTVTVTGSGFPANTGLAIAQCTNVVTDPFADCDLSFFQVVTSDDNGDYSTTFTVERLINTSAGQIDCAPTNCSLFSAVADPSNFGSPASAPLAFDPNVPPQPRLALDLTVDPRGTVVSKTGEVTVRGTVTCNMAADVFVDVFITQRAGRVLIQGDAFTELSCDGSTAFAATGTGFNGIFKGGSADADATAQGSSGTFNASAEVVTTVKLTGAGKG